MKSASKRICKYPFHYRDSTLQQSAFLALVRFMCVSSRVCDSYMPFFMIILSNTKNIQIKCSIVIGLSDLAIRFLYIIEPWTGHFYSELHDENSEFRFEVKL
uniref:Uncharacterized protein n=1 Tax=Glossina palpalis gambiensis TaxID=67801 RepID=A0A1B0BE98_9MUSC